MQDECRIQCRAARGAFEDEMIVTLPIVDSSGADTEATCLAYGDSVELSGEPKESEECEATLRVHCLGERGEIAAIVLPQSTLQNGPNVIVRKKNLIEQGADHDSVGP